VIECAKVANNRLKTKVVPRNWAGQELLEEVVMSADITVQPDHVHVVRGGFDWRYFALDIGRGRGMGVGNAAG